MAEFRAEGITGLIGGIMPQIGPRKNLGFNYSLLTAFIEVECFPSNEIRHVADLTRINKASAGHEVIRHATCRPSFSLVVANERTPFFAVTPS